MADKFSTFPIMVHTFTTFVDYNKLLKCLDTQLNVPTNQNSVKVPKVVQPMNNKTLL